MQQTKDPKLAEEYSNLAARSIRGRRRKRDSTDHKIQVGARFNTDELVATAEILQYLKEKTGVELTLSAGIAWAIKEAHRSIKAKLQEDKAA